MRFAHVALAAAIVFSCQSSEEKGPPPTCVGDCGLPPGTSTELPPPGGGNGGEGGSSPDTTGVELTGSVGEMSDDLNFAPGVMLQVFLGMAELKTDGAKRSPVTAQWDGANPPYVLKDVLVAAPVWVLITPQNPLADDMLPALEPVRTDQVDSSRQLTTDFVLVHASTIDGILDRASMPLMNDSTKAQVVLELVDTATNGQAAPPLAGVTVTATADSILYGASGTFSDIVTATDATGVVVLANVPAAAWPGAIVNVQFSGVKTGHAQVRAITGTVTVATITP